MNPPIEEKPGTADSTNGPEVTEDELGYAFEALRRAWTDPRYRKAISAMGGPIN